MDRALTVAAEGATAPDKVEGQVTLVEKHPTRPRHNHGLAEATTEAMVPAEVADMEVVALPQRLPQLLRGGNHHPGWDCRVDRGCGLGDHGEMAWIAEERLRGSLPTSYELRATGYELY
jgi:hypothetical protein